MIALRKLFVTCSLALALLMVGCGKKEHKKNGNKVTFGESSQTLVESQIPVLNEEVEEDFFDGDNNDDISEFAFVDDDSDGDFETDALNLGDDEKLVEDTNTGDFDSFDDNDEEDNDSFVAWDDEEEKEPNFKTVQFDLNRNTIKKDQQEFLQENIEAAKMAIADGKTVVVQGHCCQLGSPSYNISLSKKRAEAIKSEMVKNGLPADKIKTIGYGQEMPLVWSEKTDKKELIKELAPNRRAEIVIG